MEAITIKSKTINLLKNYTQKKLSLLQTAQEASKLFTAAQPGLSGKSSRIDPQLAIILLKIEEFAHLYNQKPPTKSQIQFIDKEIRGYLQLANNNCNC